MTYARWIPSIFLGLTRTLANIFRYIAVAFLCSATLTMVACKRSSNSQYSWELTQVQGHLPDLGFSLTSDQDIKVTEKNYRGKVALVYFGYTYCPDVCPETLSRLMQAITLLGVQDAEAVRILFISVDPARDRPNQLHDYVHAFDPKHIVGLTGSHAQIEALAKRYRVAYEASKPDSDNQYEVMHSSAVYIFDKAGRARLIATSSDSATQIAHDVRQLSRTPYHEEN